MLHGEQPYKDNYIQYGPLMIYPVFLLFKLFGETFFVLRLWMIFCVFLGYAAALYAIKKLNLPSAPYYICAISLMIVPGVNIRQWIGVLAIIFFIESFHKK